mmetsp:Transcript_97820/g.285494  ORF Transcript_97820/g.285494 Transcript_97820/m.285494 type:complete len:359 (-) Transcript_97820:77-1153(-)
MRAASPILLCCTSLLPGALGLRLSRNASEAEALDVAGELAAAELEHWALPRNSSAADEPPLTEEAALEMADSEQEHVPHFERFKQAWTRRYSMETHLQEPLPKEVQLVLGLLTVAEDGSFRQVVRETWLRQAGVCYWSLEPKANCSVYAAFVIGKTGTGAGRKLVSDVNLTARDLRRSRKEPGMLVLDTEENMESGKSFVWFSTALEMFPWATHIAKSDMDTYPFLHKLIYRMNRYRDCANQEAPYEYMGKFCAVTRTRYSFDNACPLSACAGSTLDTTALNIGHGFAFMQGGLYILSRPLVEKMNWNRSRGFEDAAIGQRVDSAAGQQHFCVVLRRPDAWFHNNARISSHFANQFEV